VFDEVELRSGVLEAFIDAQGVFTQRVVDRYAGHAKPCAACSNLCRKRPTESWSRWEDRRFCSRRCSNVTTSPLRSKRKTAV